MKKLLAILIIPAAFTSCKSTWTQSDKDALYQACMEDATQWAGDRDHARTYCDCVTIKVMEKYPHVSDALEHIETLSTDPEIRACRTPIMK